MKLIVATIQPDKLEAIEHALQAPGTYVLYVTKVGDLRESLLGHYRGAEYRNPRPALRLEIVVVNDLVVQDVIDTINEIACTPNGEHVSTGSIFVIPLNQWVRIPAEQLGSTAEAGAGSLNTHVLSMASQFSDVQKLKHTKKS